MLTFHIAQITNKGKNTRNRSQKSKNTQQIQKIPNLKFFTLKKPIFITHKHRQELYSDRLHQKIP